LLTKDLVQEGRYRLSIAGIEYAEDEAGFILAEVMGINRGEVFARWRDPVPPGVEEEFLKWVRRRSRREPLQYIAGRAWFWGREFTVSRGVFIPRPETEVLVEAVLELCRGKEGRVVDVGTGSGVIAITLCMEGISSVCATDISREALRVARRNAARYGAVVGFYEGDMLAGIEGSFLGVVSNPPYLTEKDLFRTQAELVWEPLEALYGGKDGMDFIRRLVDESYGHIEHGGFIALEVGEGQVGEVGKLMKGYGLSVRVRDDLAGIPRVVIGIKE